MPFGEIAITLHAVELILIISAHDRVLNTKYQHEELILMICDDIDVTSQRLREMMGHSGIHFMDFQSATDEMINRATASCNLLCGSYSRWFLVHSQEWENSG